MLIKSADDKSKRLKLLEQLQDSAVLENGQREWLSKQLHSQRTGMAGERNAAHYIDNHYRDRTTHAVIHDLRIQVGGESAQIDHLVISRGMHFYLLETKTFNGNLFISEHGEFSVEYAGGSGFGIESPLEQSRRHGNVLAKLLRNLGISRRLGAPPHFHHLVLVHPKGKIARPQGLKTDHVIQADQFATWHEKFQSKLSVAQALPAIINLRSVSTLKRIAEKIAHQHIPVDQLALPLFMAPKANLIQEVAAVRRAPAAPGSAPRKRLVCSTCGVKISIQEGRFCWNNERRFGGHQFCRAHQIQPT
ncbi:MAG: nuclease-related domain-containing protein [Telluria sp.]